MLTYDTNDTIQRIIIQMFSPVGQIITVPKDVSIYNYPPVPVGHIIHCTITCSQTGETRSNQPNQQSDKTDTNNEQK